MEKGLSVSRGQPWERPCSEYWQECAPQLVRAAMKGMSFIWQFNQRDTHVWAHLLSAGQARRECYEGDLTSPP